LAAESAEINQPVLRLFRPGGQIILPQELWYECVGNQHDRENHESPVCMFPPRAADTRKMDPMLSKVNQTLSKLASLL
jgi:hypothetical protein